MEDNTLITVISSVGLAGASAIAFLFKHTSKQNLLIITELKQTIKALEDRITVLEEEHKEELNKKDILIRDLRHKNTAILSKLVLNESKLNMLKNYIENKKTISKEDILSLIENINPSDSVFGQIVIDNY